MLVQEKRRRHYVPLNVPVLVLCSLSISAGYETMREPVFKRGSAPDVHFLEGGTAPLFGHVVLQTSSPPVNASCMVIYLIPVNVDDLYSMDGASV